MLESYTVTLANLYVLKPTASVSQGASQRVLLLKYVQTEA